MTMAARLRTLVDGLVFAGLVLFWWLAFLATGGRDR